ncbi:LAETG motif-containing sortase-dependent surface protein [Streptomyces sp. CA-111067]|uniref:LAETG motif-containing sortase-dependent surface protein n=1 Tax=Streptomyces sp. CA-111067 TaxID=3240046 RepID=UPI003D963B4E
MRAITKRAVGVAATIGSITAVVTLAGIGTASAHGNNGGNNGAGCDSVGIEYKIDGGHWTTSGRINGDTPPTKISVRLTDNPGKNCRYDVSLASYSAEGPAWENSGQQDFLGWDTVTLNKGKKSATLDVSGSAPTCFGQVDLYGNGTEFDGGAGSAHGPLPHYPNSATPTNLITAWNGGHECQSSPTPTPTATTDSPSPTPTETTGSPTPTATTDSPSPTPTETTGSPTATPTETTGSPSPSVDDTSSPSPTTSVPTSTTAPTGTPSVPPATSPSGNGDLAETGSNSSQNVAFIGGGAALLVVGGAAVYFARRRNNGAHN